MAELRIIDDLQRVLLLPRAPRRIVSLVPSDTQSLFALGAGERVVGATRFCVEPAGALQLPRVGGTKDPEPEAIAALKPDLVLLNQEENTRAVVRELALRGIPMLISFPRTVGEGIAHLARLARALELLDSPRAKEAVAGAYRALAAAEQRLAQDAREGQAPLATFVPIWREPWMTISGETFVSDMLRLCGACNLFADRQRRYPLAADLGRAEALSQEQIGERDTRYPRITEAELLARDPEAVLLPEEPYAFGESDAAQLLAQPTRAGRSGAVRLCSGRDLMWYGARSAEALPRLRALVDSLRA